MANTLLSPLTLGPIVKIRLIRRPISQINPNWIPENGRPVYGTDDAGTTVLSEKLGDGVTQYQVLQELLITQNYKRWVSGVPISAFNLLSTNNNSSSPDTLFIARSDISSGSDTVAPALSQFFVGGTSAYTAWQNSNNNFGVTYGNYLFIQNSVQVVPASSGMNTFPLFSKPVGALERGQGGGRFEFTISGDQNATNFVNKYVFFSGMVPSTPLDTWYELPASEKDTDTITAINNGTFIYKIHVDVARTNNNYEFRSRIEVLSNTGSSYDQLLVTEFKDSGDTSFFASRAVPSNYWNILNSGTDPNTIIPKWLGIETISVPIINNISIGVGTSVPYSIRARGNTAIFSNTLSTNIANFQNSGTNVAYVDNAGTIGTNTLVSMTGNGNSTISLSAAGVMVRRSTSDGNPTLFVQALSPTATGDTFRVADSLNTFLSVGSTGTNTTKFTPYTVNSVGLGTHILVGGEFIPTANNDIEVGLDINTIFGTSKIANVDTIVGGIGYPNGNVTAVVNGGSGVGAFMSMTVSGGVIQTVVPLRPGANYVVGDILTLQCFVGGVLTGTGGTVRVASVTSYTGIIPISARFQNAPIVLSPISTPSNFSSGMMWQDGTHLYAYINGVARQLDQQSTGGGGSTVVSGTANRIFTIGTSSVTVDIDSNYVGQSSITTLGNIGTGSWNATPITDIYISSSSTWNAKMTNPMSVAGDLIIGGTVISGIATPTRLAIGPANWLLSVNTTGTALEYRDLATGPGLGGLLTTGLIELYVQDDVINQGDANVATVNTGNFYRLGTVLTANRTINLTSASASTGQKVTFWNKNTNGFTWTFIGTGTVVDTNGNPVTTLASSAVYLLESDGINWVVLSNSNIAVTSITGLGGGVANFLATPSSANLIATLTDETGTGSLVFANSPTLINPVVGTQTALDNSTKAASTAYVDAGIQYFVSGTFVGSVDPTTPTPGSISNKFTIGKVIGLNQLSATGTPSVTTFLRGDNSWVTPILSIGNIDSTLNISTTTGVTTASLNLANGNVWTAIQTHQFNLLGASTVDGLYLQNNTPATLAATVQVSPSLRFTAQAWNTTITAVNNFANSRIYLTATSGTSVGGILKIDMSITGTSTPSYTTVLQLDNNGDLSLNGFLFAPVSTNTKVQVNQIGSGATLNLTNGLFAQTATTSSTGTLNQWSPMVNWTAQVWNTSGTAANNWANWAAFVSTTSGTAPISTWTLASSLTTTSAPSFTNRLTLDSLGNLSITGPVKPGGYTVSTLPSSPSLGMIAYVTDATSPTYLGTLTGGGTVKTPVFYNGTAWVSV